MPDYDCIRKAYLTPERAISYKKFQETDPWTRFVTWREQRAIAKELGRYKWNHSDLLLDIPSGTGILGKVLKQFPFKIIASDISEEMMAVARLQYPTDRLIECIKADITKTPFAKLSFSCVITLSFLHLVPPEIKYSALKEIAALSNRIAIVSCSVDSSFQRIKQTILPWIRRRYTPAPCPAPLQEVISECESHGFRVVRAFRVVPFLSAHALLVLEKKTKNN